MTFFLALGIVVLVESLLLVAIAFLRSSGDELTPRVRRLMMASFMQGWRRGYQKQPRGNWTPELARAALDIRGMTAEEAARQRERRADWLDDAF